MFYFFSFDELLNENFKTTTETGGVLQPKVMTASELQELKIEAQAREDIAKASAKDPYDDPSAIQKILDELKDLEAIIDDKAMVDTMWKQVLTLAGTGSKVTVSVARYSLQSTFWLWKKSMFSLQVLPHEKSSS